MREKERVFKFLPTTGVETAAYFVVAVLGFSFWFLIGVPFASHRESYWWLAEVQSQPFSHAFAFIMSTYRPLLQAATWFAFMVLEPTHFPTSAVRQAIVQCFVYSMFVGAWWLMYSTARWRRTLALVAFVSGGVFFSGYVQLFHVYGIAYVAVILMLAVLLRLHATGTFDDHETRLGAMAAVLALWHPFATAIFVAFSFGHYFETFRTRSLTGHLRTLAILIVGTAMTALVVVIIPRVWPTASDLVVQTAMRPLNTRLLGLLASYQTNEVNAIASVVGFVMAELTALSVGQRQPSRAVVALMVGFLAAAFGWAGLPMLLLWFCVVLAKLAYMRAWSLLFLMSTAMLLPFGGGIGTPIYALFAIGVAIYAVSLEWSEAEMLLSRLRTSHVLSAIGAVMLIMLLVRSGVDLPVITKAATPLLEERERTYQLETILAWLHESTYCANELTFAESADNPVDSVESAISREHRPPTSIHDVQLFWRTAMQCQADGKTAGQSGPVVVTFNGPPLPDHRAVYTVEGRYAGNGTVWASGARQ